MSIGELFYRAKQIYKRRSDRKKAATEIKRLDFEVRFRDLLNHDLSSIDAIKLQDEVDVFNYKIAIDEKIKWHYDPYSDEYFAKDYAFDLSPRNHGNKCVKHTWEVNRFQFIVNWALKYKTTKDDHYLQLIQSVINDWVEENPYLVGVNWYSGLEASIRLLNWWLCCTIIDINNLRKKNEKFEKFYENVWLPVIYQHVKFIDRYLSKHSSANNHLIGELAALFVATKAWDFPESKKWNNKSRHLLEKEIQLQHSKGINREQASEYIQFITEFLLLAFWVDKNNGSKLSKKYVNKLELILDYIFEITDKNGDVFFYGDADDGHVFKLSDSENNFVDILSIGSVLFGKSGYKLKGKPFSLKNKLLYGLDKSHEYEKLDNDEIDYGSKFYSEEGHFYFKKEEKIFAHFNVAELGYLSTAAHGHADCLSFELKVNGQWFLVDTGTYSYHKEPLYRNYFKGTKAHNTLVIEGENQAKNVAPMIWHEHYQPSVVKSESSEKLDIVVGGHNGYEKFGLIHERKIEFNKVDEEFIIFDRLKKSDEESKSVDVYFHLHPEIHVSKEGEAWKLLDNKGQQVILTIDDKLNQTVHYGEKEPLLGWYSQGFYKVQPTNVIKASAVIANDLEFVTKINIENG